MRDYGADIAKGITGGIAGIITGINPIYWALLTLMGLDYLSGFLAAAAGHRVNSSTGLKGLCRKGLILCVVAATAIFSVHLAGLHPGLYIPAGEVIAGGFAVNEFVSILENADRAGVRLPDVIRRALLKEKERQP